MRKAARINRIFHSKMLQKLSVHLSSGADQKQQKAYSRLVYLLDALQHRPLKPDSVVWINTQLQSLNDTAKTGKNLRKQLRCTRTTILTYLAKEEDLVPRGYYQHQWMMLGMTIFGLPIGVTLGLSLGNIGLMGIGLPLGMFMGMSVGASKDRKARESERQLPVRIYG